MRPAIGFYAAFCIGTKRKKFSRGSKLLCCTLYILQGLHHTSPHWWFSTPFLARCGTWTQRTLCPMWCLWWPVRRCSSIPAWCSSSWSQWWPGEQFSHSLYWCGWSTGWQSQLFKYCLSHWSIETQAIGLH